MSKAFIANENSIASQIFVQCQKKSNQTNAEIAKALGIEPKSVSSRTSQMVKTGRLIGKPRGDAGDVRAIWVYSAGDASKPPAPSVHQQREAKARKEAQDAKTAAKAKTVKNILNGAVQHATPEWEMPTTQTVSGVTLDETPEATPAYVAQDREDDPNMLTMTAQLTPPPPEPSTVRASWPLRDLIQGMAVSIADEIMVSLRSELTSRVTDMAIELKTESAKPMPTPAELALRLTNAAKPPAIRLKTVTIVGLKPDQQQRIKKDFDGCFDLRFWYDESLDVLKSYARGSDHVLGCTAAMSHTAAGAIDAVGKRVSRLPGGQTQLVNKLTELYVQSTTTAN